MTKDTLRVQLGERAYDIVVGEGLLAEAGRRMAPLLPQKNVIVVTDATVAKLHLETLEASLDEAGIHHSSIVLDAGERTKDFAHLQALTQEVLEKGIERATTLVALGGGVIGDICGFCAAITLRGLSFVQVPTTLLAQVDSSVGGKTGINTPQGKNLVGAFHQPVLVLADLATLETLDRRQLLAGYAEVMKYGLINDADFFSWLEENAQSLLGGNVEARRHGVMTSCAAKAAIVAEDERESGCRALLNLGHTFAHAFEAESGYSSTLIHGEAVALGMSFAFDLSVRMGVCPAQDAERVRDHLDRVGLPSDFSAVSALSWTADALMEHMAKDKKVKGGKMTFILARGIGQSFITQDVQLDDVRSLLHDKLIPTALDNDL